jgi:glycosyltransferase involved in cell wall biosynthesis
MELMRLGQNPAKSIRHVAQPEKVTVAVTAYIPFLGGYYTHSFEVLKVCLGSILANTDQPFDLMVFDNASCPEVVRFLETLREQGKIQFLILSSKNVGKVGAWNTIFGAAPGEYIAYSDMDVYYYPGWLSKHLAVFDAFPEAGTVAGLPRRGDLLLYRDTIRQLDSLSDTKVEEGRLISMNGSRIMTFTR